LHRYQAGDPVPAVTRYGCGARDIAIHSTTKHDIARYSPHGRCAYEIGLVSTSAHAAVSKIFTVIARSEVASRPSIYQLFNKFKHLRSATAFQPELALNLHEHGSGTGIVSR
jgi:hypothetical protein